MEDLRGADNRSSNKWYLIRAYYKNFPSDFPNILSTKKSDILPEIDPLACRVNIITGRYNAQPSTLHQQNNRAGSYMLNKILVKPLLLISAYFLPILTYAHEGELILTIIDDANNLETPARVEIKGGNDQFFIANDALPAGGDCDMSDDGAQLEDSKSALKHFSKVIVNPYFNSEQFYSDGLSTIQNLPGEVTVSVFKGSEFIPTQETIEIKAESKNKHTVRLKRWTNMREKNWYSADDHLHIPRLDPEMNTYISKMMQAEDIHVGNLLQSGKAKNFEMAKQYAFGQPGIYTEKGYILASGQENPRTHVLGHTITLGASAPVFNKEKYMVYRLIWEKAVELGGLNGIAHAWGGEADGPSPQNGMAILLPHDLAHFIEVLQFNRADYDSWYDVLNLGFKIAPTAGSDYPCADQTIPGHERFYTKVKGEFTYQNWLKGIEQGKTFVTTGPVITFSVNGQDLGANLKLQSGSLIDISGNVKFDPTSDNINFIEVVHNGRVIKKISRTNHSDSMSFIFSHTLKNSGWFALRGYGDKLKENLYPNPIHLDILKASTNFHSAPIYVEVPGHPNPETSAVAYSWLQRLDDLEVQLAPENLDFFSEKIMNPWHGIPKDILLSSRESLLKEIAHAKDYFKSLSSEY